MILASIYTLLKTAHDAILSAAVNGGWGGWVEQQRFERAGPGGNL